MSAGHGNWGYKGRSVCRKEELSKLDPRRKDSVIMGVEITQLVSEVEAALY